MTRHVNIPVFIPNLGCPYKCVFCDQREISGARFDISSVDRTISEALATVEDGAECEIAFFGGSFTGIGIPLMTRLLDIAKKYTDSGCVSSIRLSTRPDMIDGEILDVLSRYPVKTVELGIQSISDRVLAVSKRGHTADVTEKACRMVRDYGFGLVGQMMIGLPGSTPEDEKATAEFICSAGAYAARIYPAVVLRRTEMESMAEEGTYQPLTVEDAVIRAADCLEIFIAGNVRPLRIGLCASDGLSESDAVGGAYHPAMGELVMSEVYLRRMISAIEAADLAGADTVTIYVPRGKTSAAVGQKRHNIAAVRSKLNINTLKFIENPALAEYNICVSPS